MKELYLLLPLDSLGDQRRIEYELRIVTGRAGCSLASIAMREATIAKVVETLWLNKMLNINLLYFLYQRIAPDFGRTFVTHFL